MHQKYGKNGKIWIKYGNIDITVKIWKNIEYIDIKLDGFTNKTR
jgi:hypothetical protein